MQEEWAAKEKQTSEEDNENILPEQMSKMEQEIEAVGIQGKSIYLPLISFKLFNFHHFR